MQAQLFLGCGFLGYHFDVLVDAVGFLFAFDALNQDARRWTRICIKASDAMLRLLLFVSRRLRVLVCVLHIFALFCHLASINCKDHDLPEKTMTITVSMQKVLLLDN